MQIASMESRLSEAHGQSMEVEQRTDRIRMEINNYRQISTARWTEQGAVHVYGFGEDSSFLATSVRLVYSAIDSMFDLARRYSHRVRRKELRRETSVSTDRQDRFMKLKHVGPSRYTMYVAPVLAQIDTFLSDLTSYVDHVASRGASAHRSSAIGMAQGDALPPIGVHSNGNEQDHRWYNACEKDRQQISVKTIESSGPQPSTRSFFTYTVKGHRCDALALCSSWI